MSNMKNLLDRISSDKYHTIDAAMNTLTNNRPLINNGLLLIAYKDEKIDFVLCYEKNNLNFSTYEIVCAKKSQEDRVELSLATDSQRASAIKIAKSNNL